MPTPAVAPVAAKVGWAVVGAALKAFAIKAAIAIAVSAGVNAYARDQAKKSNNLPEKEAISRTATQPKSRSYGYTVKSGTLAYMNAVQTEHSGGVSSHELHMVIVIDGQAVGDIKDIYLDGHNVLGGVELNWTTNTVTSGFYAYSGGASDCEAVKVWRFDGTQTTRSTELADHYGGDITTAHVGRGYSYVVIRFAYTRYSLTVFENGQPQTIRVGFNGAKVYDPRKDSTVAGGSGSHRFATPSTWEYSNNPILCAADYKTQVMHTAGARMDWVHIMTQADICDVLVPIPGSLTEKRYTCNGSVSLGLMHGENMQAILDTCMGRPRFVGGLWSFYAGAYPTPDVTLTEADILADFDITVSTALPRDDTYNVVRAFYTGEDFGYHDTDALEMRSPAFITRDGGVEIPKSLNLPLVTSETLAQRIEYKTLQQSDMQTIVTLPLWWTGMKCVVGGVVQITLAPFSWSGAIFRCINLKYGGDVPVEGTFRQESSGSWADPNAVDYSTRTAAGVIVPGVYTVHPPIDLTAVSLNGGVQLYWTQPSDHMQNDYYRVYAATSNSFASAVVVFEGTATQFKHETANPQWYWIYSVRGNSEGDRYPSGTTSTITGIPRASRGALGQFPFVEDFSDNDYARFMSEWGSNYTAVPESIVIETGTPAPVGGQYVLEAGNNSGTNDISYKVLNFDWALPVEEDSLYRMIAVFRKKSGSDNSFFGVAALDQTKAAYLTVGGGHVWVTAYSYAPPSSAWVTRIGYFKTSSGAGGYSGGTTTPSAPGLLPAGTKFIVPTFSVNNAVGTGSYQIGYLALQRVNGDGEVTTIQIDPNAATQTFEVFTAGPSTYNNSTAPTNYQTLTVTGGMDSDSVVIVNLQCDITASVGGGASASAIVHLSWSGGSSDSDNFRTFVSGVKQRCVLRRMFDTSVIPANTTFSVLTSLGVGAGGAPNTITIENATLEVEVVKR